MMEVIQNILSSPLPIAICVIITICCLAGFWFFVIPMMEEAQALRAKDKDNGEQIAKLLLMVDGMQTRIGAEADAQRAKTQQLMEEVIAGQHSQTNILELIASVNSLRSRSEQQLTSISTSLEVFTRVLNEAIERLDDTLDEAKNDSVHKHEDTRKELERLSRMLENVTNALATINEKQSQVTGVLTGLSIAKTRTL